MDNIKVLVGIITYNPNINRLIENVEAIIDQCNECVICDNGSGNITDIIDAFKEERRVNFIRNKENKGIAKAINQIMAYADELKYEWFLTLDQDSVCMPRLIDTYLKFVSPEIGQITCNIVDRNIGALSKHKDDLECLECEGCITSGALNNTKAMKKIGGGTNLYSLTVLI